MVLFYGGLLGSITWLCEMFLIYFSLLTVLRIPPVPPSTPPTLDTWLVLSVICMDSSAWRLGSFSESDCMIVVVWAPDSCSRCRLVLWVRLLVSQLLLWGTALAHTEESASGRAPSHHAATCSQLPWPLSFPSASSLPPRLFCSFPRAAPEFQVSWGPRGTLGHQ